MAGIPAIAGYGGMPVSGRFLVCQKPEIVEKNRNKVCNKVYGQAATGAPPMSVPYYDGAMGLSLPTRAGIVRELLVISRFHV